jgi:hypothetical protein
MQNCKKCKKKIPDERLEFLLEYRKDLTCVNCSNEGTFSGFMDYGHKTAPQLVLVPNSDTEALRIAKRAFRRAR